MKKDESKLEFRPVTKRNEGTAANFYSNLIFSVEVLYYLRDYPTFDP